jgi:hypothetical protein
MQLNPKYPVQLKKVYINELVELLRLVNAHLDQVDKSYKQIKDKDLDKAIGMYGISVKDGAKRQAK